MLGHRDQGGVGRGERGAQQRGNSLLDDGETLFDSLADPTPYDVGSGLSSLSTRQSGDQCIHKERYGDSDCPVDRPNDLFAFVCIACIRRGVSIGLNQRPVAPIRVEVKASTQKTRMAVVACALALIAASCGSGPGETLAFEEPGPTSTVVAEVEPANETVVTADVVESIRK